MSDETFNTILAWTLTSGAIAIDLIASGHAVLYKRDARSTIGWVGVIWLVPFIGALLYTMLGINRISRRAKLVRSDTRMTSRVGRFSSLAHVPLQLPAEADHLASLRDLVERVVEAPLLSGNDIDLLIDGDEAFPAMLDAIRGAEASVGMCTYIFDHDRAGALFVDALADAAARGVEVRVLIDDVGARYSRPRVPNLLRRRGVRCARFMKTTVPWRFAYFNLRTHRKILVVDGNLGFTGGMNIREGCMRSLWDQIEAPFHDIHARIRGPLVGQLQDAFCTDWAFTTGEQLGGIAWFPTQTAEGGLHARAIQDGPDENFEQLQMTLQGALSVAREHVRIVTPYFLPPAALIAALNTAAMRGVTVDIVLPGTNNLRVVQWASTANLWQVVGRGCRVWLSPPPFDHTKLMTVDDAWTLFGSANWDPRSLRLNFEFDVEVYDRAFALRAAQLIDARIAAARSISLHDLESRGLARRFRDGIARLMTPYL